MHIRTNIVRRLKKKQFVAVRQRRALSTCHRCIYAHVSRHERKMKLIDLTKN